MADQLLVEGQHRERRCICERSRFREVQRVISSAPPAVVENAVPTRFDGTAKGLLSPADPRHKDYSQTNQRGPFSPTWQVGMELVDLDGCGIYKLAAEREPAAC